MTSDLLLSGLSIIGLLLFSAFFSGSETALTAASRARIHRLAADGDKRARLVERLMDNRERLIGSILLGNNLVNIMASALATGMFLRLVGESGVIYATLAMTTLVLIFAEVLPKTYAITRPDQVALGVAAPIRLATALFSPAVILVQRIVRFTLRTFGVNVTEADSFLSSHEEIRGHIALHASEGGIVKEHRDMLGGILDLDEVFVEDIMVHRKNMEMIDADEPPKKIIEQIIATPHTRLPVYREDPENIIGVLHAKDVLRALLQPGARPENLDLTAIANEPWFVPETTSLREQMNAFLARKQHFAIVVDEYGALMGLITLEDILEEIVGEIADEYDILQPEGIEVHEDGSVTVEGTVSIRDLNRRMDWSLPDDEAATVAGLVLNEARIIPVKGQSFDFFGHRFEILKRQRHQLTLIRITPQATPR